MISREMVKQYLRYIVPSMLAFTLTGIYSIVDGVFVGHAVGDSGLAGINIAFPAVALVLALGTGIGMGGAVISSIQKAEGKAGASQKTIGTTMVLLFLAAIPLMVAFLFFSEQICWILGGRGANLAQAVEYLRVIAWGVPFQILTMGSIPLIRNKGNVGYAMAVSMIAGTINAGLDFVFVIHFGFGTAGAAAATAISQVVSFIFCVVYFARKKNRIARRDLGLSKKTVAHIATLGLAPFGLSLLPEVTVIAININAEMYGGQTAVAAYAVISYVAVIVQLLIQGVGDGSQPLISTYYGKRDLRTVKKLRNTNYLIAISIGVIGFFGMFFMRDIIPVLFGASEASSVIIAYALPIFAFSFIFYGFTHPSTSYFYAIDDSRSSNIIVYGEALLVVIGVAGLGMAFGMEGVWHSVAAVQAVLSLVALILLGVSRRKLAGAKSVSPFAFDPTK